jgi:hypothetical protein
MRAHKHVSPVGPQAPVDDKQLAVAAEVLAHLADPTRLHLLRLLILEQDVSTLTALVGEALEYAEHAVQGIPHHQRHVAGLDD